MRSVKLRTSDKKKVQEKLDLVIEKLMNLGAKVMNINAATIAIKNGSSFFITSSTCSLATLQPTKSTFPTGGVMVPMDRFMTIMTPN